MMIAMIESRTAARVAVPTPSAPPLGAQSGAAADDRDQDAEDARLEQPRVEVLGQREDVRRIAQRLDGRVEVELRADVQLRLRHEAAAEDPDRVAQDRQERRRDHDRHQARQHQQLDPVDREHLERRELVGDGHRADLGRHRAAHRRGQDGAGDERAHLARHRDRDDRADLVLLADALQLDARLQRHDHADEEADQQHHVQALHRALVEDLRHRAHAPRQVVEARQRPEQELDLESDPVAELDEGLEEPHESSLRVPSCAGCVPVASRVRARPGAVRAASRPRACASG